MAFDVGGGSDGGAEARGVGMEDGTGESVDR